MVDVVGEYSCSGFGPSICLMSENYRVDFGRPIALFPLSGAVLLPHGAQPLHLFEPRYTQMVEQCIAAGKGVLDSSEPIAMAVVDKDGMDGDGPLPLKSAVCIGRIDQHLMLPDGRHNIVLHGICRAKIDEIDEPTGDRLFRRAWLRPLERADAEMPPMLQVREVLRDLLAGPRLNRMAAASAVVECIDREDVPTSVLLELIGFAVLLDEDVRYSLLAEADCRQRAIVVRRELELLDQLVGKVDRQRPHDWPKGTSFN